MLIVVPIINVHLEQLALLKIIDRCVNVYLDILEQALELVKLIYVVVTLIVMIVKFALLIVKASSIASMHVKAFDVVQTLIGKS